MPLCKSVPLFGLKHFLLALLVFTMASGEVKRSRSEDLVEVRASNTEGFSNIWAGLDVEAEKRDEEILVEPRLTGRVGLASLMQLSGSTRMPKRRTLGTTDLHAQLTLPNNDNLRIFGFGAGGDLLLSTSEDTASETPEFKPHLGFSVMMDIDLIKISTWLPLKIYMNITTLDDEKLMLHMDAVSLRGGMEIKLERFSLFGSGNIGIYKERKPDTGTGSYNNIIIWAHPGIRVHLGSRINLVGRGKMLLAKRGDSPYLPEQVIGGSLYFEMPIFFRDTNAEAMRTLIFADRKKMRSQVHQYRQIKATRQLHAQADSTAMESGTNEARAKEIMDIIGSDYYKRKEELVKRRKKALEEIKKIEEMLE